MTPWSPLRIWSLVVAGGVGLVLAASTITSYAFHATAVDEPPFWLGVVVAAVATTTHVGAFLRDQILKDHAGVRTTQQEILDRIGALEEHIGDYGDSREIQGQATAFAARATANGRHLGALPD